MTRRKTSSRVLGALAAVVLPLLLTSTAAPAQAATAPAGAFAEAYGLSIDTTLLQGNVPVKVDPLAETSSSCPPTGAGRTTQLLGAGDPAVARADVLNSGAGTDCAAKSALAKAQTVDVDALGAAAPVKIHADAVTATSATSCAAAPTGSTVVTHLSIGGTAVPLPTDVPPNTVVLSPVLDAVGLRLIVNEQHPAATGRGLVVNGLHLIAAGFGQVPVGGVLARGDVVVSHAVSGVVCPGGPGSTNGGLPKPDISFKKAASPTTAGPGEKVTYTATVTNTSSTPCEVLRFVDHVAPVFDLVSSSGPLGTRLDSPAPKRADGGVDAVLRPTGVTIGAGKSVVQTFTVKVKAGAAPGTYYDTLELFCGPNGDFVSGPLAPVTVPGAALPLPHTGGVTPAAPVVADPHELPHTGGSPLLAGAALALTAAALGLRRLRSATS
ncbi:MAG: hypothetical protein WCD35_04710 [Mycobacteriales bacterium]